MVNDVVARYAALSKALHWVIALIVILMLSLSFFLEDVPNDYRANVFMVHKSLGLTILGLIIIRLFAIIHYGRPPLPIAVPTWERVLSRAVQYAFYVLLILMPVSGWVMSTAADKAPVYFNWFKLPFPGVTPNKALAQWMFSAHEFIAWTLIVLVVLHVMGALKHYFIDKDDVLQRML